MLTLLADSSIRWEAVLALLGPLALLSQGCVDPVRTPLPAPVTAVRGGTPVPGNGIGLGMQLGDGLQGQELLRKELLTGEVVLGFRDRVNVTAAVYGGRDDSDPAGFLFAGKVRVGSPLGERTSTALHAGIATVDRLDGAEQDEALTALDVAVPTELLLVDPGAEARFSVYAGPRLLYERYRDRLVPGDSFEGTLPGLLSGLHLDLGHVHLFGEGTVLWRPESRYRGTTYEGGPIFLPSGGVVVHLGSPFRWDR